MELIEEYFCKTNDSKNLWNLFTQNSISESEILSSPETMNLFYIFIDMVRYFDSIDRNYIQLVSYYRENPRYRSSFDNLYSSNVNMLKEGCIQKKTKDKIISVIGLVLAQEINLSHLIINKFKNLSNHYFQKSKLDFIAYFDGNSIEQDKFDRIVGKPGYTLDIVKRRRTYNKATHFMFEDYLSGNPVDNVQFVVDDYLVSNRTKKLRLCEILYKNKTSTNRKNSFYQLINETTRPATHNLLTDKLIREVIEESKRIYP